MTETVSPPAQMALGPMSRGRGAPAQKTRNDLPTSPAMRGTEGRTPNYLHHSDKPRDGYSCDSGAPCITPREMNISLSVVAAFFHEGGAGGD